MGNPRASQSIALQRRWIDQRIALIASGTCHVGEIRPFFGGVSTADSPQRGESISRRADRVSRAWPPPEPFGPMAAAAGFRPEPRWYRAAVRCRWPSPHSDRAPARRVAVPRARSYCDADHRPRTIGFVGVERRNLAGRDHRHEAVAQNVAELLARKLDPGAASLASGKFR